MLLFKRHEIKDFDFKPQQKENTIEVKIEPVSKPAKEQEELIDDPIKLIPTNAQQVGLPDAPAFTVPSLNPMPVEQQSIEDAETEPEPEADLPDSLIYLSICGGNYNSFQVDSFTNGNKPLNKSDLPDSKHCEDLI